MSITYTRDYILIANFFGMALIPFAILAVLNFRLYRKIKVFLFVLLYLYMFIYFVLHIWREKIVAFTWDSPSWFLIVDLTSSNTITNDNPFNAVLIVVIKNLCNYHFDNNHVVLWEKNEYMFWNILILHTPNDHKLWFLTYFTRKGLSLKKRSRMNFGFYIILYFYRNPSSHNRGGKQSTLIKLTLMNFRFYIMLFFCQLHNNIPIKHLKTSNSWNVDIWNIRMCKM